MRLLGLVAIYQRPHTSKPAVAHKVYPYLLGGLVIERVNQVWCLDVTYIPMPKGFFYLVTPSAPIFVSRRSRPQAFLVNLPRRAITEALVLALLVVEAEPSADAGLGFAHGRIGRLPPV
jgi:hypothetical protein